MRRQAPTSPSWATAELQGQQQAAVLAKEVVQAPHFRGGAGRLCSKGGGRRRHTESKKAGGEKLEVGKRLALARSMRRVSFLRLSFPALSPELPPPSDLSASIAQRRQVAGPHASPWQASIAHLARALAQLKAGLPSRALTLLCVSQSQRENCSPVSTLGGWSLRARAQTCACMGWAA